MEAPKIIQNSPKEQVKIPEQSVAYRVIKRCFDFVSALCVSIVLLIPMAIIALLIVAKDFGNPFYVQRRVGQNGKTLGIVKFRSMVKNADHLEEMLSPEQLAQYKREYKLDDDPRLIGYGRPGNGKRCFGEVLRKTSLDELPQILWNICLKGDMSVVGPRPILLEELEKNYSEDEQQLLLSVKPGLTGYWQAYARNNADYESGRRQEMELHYVYNRSLLLDVKIIFQTVRAVLTKEGAK